MKITSKIIEKDSNNSLNNKWKKYLDDYNNYTKEYIKHYKKSIDGNSNSLLKYPYMKAKAEELCAKLLDAQEKNHLTEKQIENIYKIQMKIAKNCLV